MNKYTKRRKQLKWARRLCIVLLIASASIFSLKTFYSIGKKVVLESDLNSLSSPISILIMGGDSSEERGTVPLVDSIILLTINPNNERGNISFDALSIPRDTRVEYVLNDQEQDEYSYPYYGKINSVYGYAYNETGDETKAIEATVNTVENFLDTTIDYYAYTDFAGIIELVDAVGGININVPYDFCEQDSTDSSDAICLVAGDQVLNGEQALAYARQRKAINPETGTSGDDWERNIRQQEVIAALASKVLSNPSSYALSIYNAVEKGAVIHNISVPVLTTLANFAVSTQNDLRNALENQSDINIIFKSSPFNHQVAINSEENVFGTTLNYSDQTLADIYPELGTDNPYYENTLVNYVNYNFRSTTTPTKEVDQKIDPITIEMSMVTMNTQNADDGSSDQVLDQETLEYYKAFVEQAKNLNK